ncbi:MAG: hypothetical protein H0U92_14770, partial [Actinobacteria bacterium]|nr:hypothetical protein [Actinomycetota bacterium]
MRTSRIVGGVAAVLVAAGSIVAFNDRAGNGRLGSVPVADNATSDSFATSADMGAGASGSGAGAKAAAPTASVV